MKVFTALLFHCVHRFHTDHNGPCLVPQILHNLCLRDDCNTQKKHFFYLESEGWEGGGGGVRVSKVQHGLSENGEFEMIMQMK